TPTTPTDTGTAPVAPSLEATITPDVIHAGDEITLSVVVSGYAILDPTAVPAPAPTEGEGHVHVWFDGALIGATWYPETPIDSTGVAVGAHEFRIGLVNSGHTELDPPVEVVLPLTVE
ncbi:MAG: hypothetical protein ABMB14_34610, partial [Myxococcota bacterium]